MESKISRFSKVDIGPPIEGSSVFRAFMMDDSAQKVYLGARGR